MNKEEEEAKGKRKDKCTKRKDEGQKAKKERQKSKKRKTKDKKDSIFSGGMTYSVQASLRC